ncbi:hypothetical protein ACRE_079260 [Hapsidospora chrysogenum ATCC 11550]|uniref:Uncharacterized protein n=1 Tax=Hapsidospora chrysogenum (strain ATCC 11550 / CBS 779.69 / DSM 880 / IAM 14645 / JCM 23072 / IMI 49137) TaxID=857340 RepID=A0A086SW75_HAPC1|nr:hypothetical protein ACRE_079260 [Hapsidospora chrysogenum ATCC 11550]
MEFNSRQTPESVEGKQPAHDPEPSSGKGKEPTSSQSNPTTAPRTSFGIEIEFLVAELVGRADDPDKEIAHLLPPVYRTGITKDKIHDLLKRKGIPMLSVAPSSGWEVDEDASVFEVDNQYHWRAIEMRSPASYATDETFDMVRLVMHLVTSNFRCRVNPSCGLHVHLGNGFERIEPRAARNFAALYWAAEPLLTMLHPPERSFNQYSKTSRRMAESCLSRGHTAEQMRKEIMDENDEFRARTMRHNAGERKLGETAEPPAPDFDTDSFTQAPCDDGDDTDWEADGAAPFRRPKRVGNTGTPVTEALQLNPGRLTIKRGPPEIPSRLAGGSQAEPSPSAKPVDGSQTCLPRTRQPAYHRQTPRSNNYRPIDILINGFPQRDVASTTEESIEHKRPSRKDGWSGVRELLACDVGTHQVGKLMGTPENFRHMAMNWINYTDHLVALPAWLPDSELDAAGKQQRREARHLPESWYKPEYPRVTVESRECMGSLDGDWIVTWARILFGLLEWARDADPAELMRVIGVCVEGSDGGAVDPATGEKSYDVVDLLNDVGLWAEAPVCEERLRRGEEAWFECMIFEHKNPYRVQRPDHLANIRDSGMYNWLPQRSIPPGQAPQRGGRGGTGGDRVLRVPPRLTTRGTTTPSRTATATATAPWQRTREQMARDYAAYRTRPMSTSAGISPRCGWRRCRSPPQGSE